MSVKEGDLHRMSVCLSYVQTISYLVLQSIIVNQFTFESNFEVYRTVTLAKELHYICVKLELDFSQTIIAFVSSNICIR